MARTSYTGYLRQYGGPTKRNGTPGVLPACIQFAIPISTTNQPVNKTLPAGAIPLFVQNVDGVGEGGTFFDIGTAVSPEAFAIDVAADAKTTIIGASDTGGGFALNTLLTVDTPITAGTTSSTNNVDVALYYMMSDDGSDGA